MSPFYTWPRGRVARIYSQFRYRHRSRYHNRPSTTVQSHLAKPSRATLRSTIPYTVTWHVNHDRVASSRATYTVYMDYLALTSYSWFHNGDYNTSASSLHEQSQLPHQPAPSRSLVTPKHNSGDSTGLTAGGSKSFLAS
jgi:hypothetical protein